MPSKWCFTESDRVVTVFGLFGFPRHTRRSDHRAIGMDKLSLCCTTAAYNNIIGQVSDPLEAPPEEDP